MDVTQALSDTENVYAISSPQPWSEEQRRQEAGVVDERLLYYAS